MKKSIKSILKIASVLFKAGLLVVFLSISTICTAQSKIEVLNTFKSVKPLDKVNIICQSKGTLVVKDSKNREYYRTTATNHVSVTVAGSTGKHTAVLLNNKGIAIDSSTFLVETKTKIDDGGKIGEMFDLFYTGMLVYSHSGYEEVTWKGKTYRYYVHWVLDNNNTMHGMKYFSPYGADMIDLFRETQNANGMIWSFVNPNKDDFYYYKTAYEPINYFRLDKEAWFVRQPNENHVEYNYVNLMYQQWKAGGDNAWMKKNLDCAAKALDYCVTDTVRLSKRFELLKRPYCIDSWDFQVDDEYTPFAHISPTMVVVPGKTKFGIFFGDNTGYYEACNQLAEMLEFAGLKDKAKIYSDRAKTILDKLIKLSWNGSYFTHFIDEDPNVKRNLGVDEKSQIAQGNMYSLNRGLSHEMNVSIIKTYLKLKENLPVGSPGEWYSIYPPFEKGFGIHNQKWQYMNGGIAGHAIGELARGAYENGYENYASDILDRTLILGKQYGNRVWFAYTGSVSPPPPAPNYKTIDISPQANMDLWDKGAKNVFTWMNAERKGNDMRGLPVGKQIFNNIPFEVADPDKNMRKVAIALSVKPGFPQKAEILINDTAATIYLLHSSTDNIPANVSGGITFDYADGSNYSRYIYKGKEITNWWFSELKNDYAGVAWSGTNPVSAKVGICWVAISNPNPSKKITKLVFHAPLEGGIYALLGITLADKVHYVKPQGESFGGPDNWAAANAMAALVEGLAGVKDNGLAYSNVSLSPRWTSSGTDSVNVCIHYPASDGYVAYQYQHSSIKKEIKMILTGSGNEVNVHLLLPNKVAGVNSVVSNNQNIPFTISKIENSNYVDFRPKISTLQDILIKYQ